MDLIGPCLKKKWYKNTSVKHKNQKEVRRADQVEFKVSLMEMETKEKQVIKSRTQLRSG